MKYLVYLVLFVLTVNVPAWAEDDGDDLRQIKNLKIGRISLDDGAVELKGLKVNYAEEDEDSDRIKNKSVKAYVYVDDDEELARWMKIKDRNVKVSIVYSGYDGVEETDECPFRDLIYKIREDGETEEICYAVELESVSYE